MIINKTRLELLYLQAVNHRRVKNYLKANQIYQELITVIIKEECKELIKYTWGLMMLPFLNDRRRTERLIENLKSLIPFYAIEEPEDYISSAYNYGESKWYKPDIAMQYLHSLKFFKRFTEKEFEDQIFPYLTIVKYQK